MNVIRKYGFFILLAAAILYPFVFYSSDLAARRELSFAERIVYTVSRPIQFVFTLFTDEAHGVFSSYISLHGAREEALALNEKNAKLNVQLQMLREVEIENTRMRKLLNFVKQVEVKFVSGHVQSGDPSFVYKSVRLNRGEAEGVLPGMAVVAAEGAVGVVMRSKGSFSDVLLLTDPNSDVDVIVSRNRRRGVLQGSSGQVMLLKYSDRGSRVQVGDEVVTSGLTGAFPRGITVGHVSRIKMESDGVSQIVEVDPAVNFSELSEALILLQPSHEVEIIRRIGGGDWMRQIVESVPGRSGG